MNEGAQCRDKFQVSGFTFGLKDGPSGSCTVSGSLGQHEGLVGKGFGGQVMGFGSWTGPRILCAPSIERCRGAGIRAGEDG